MNGTDNMIGERIRRRRRELGLRQDRVPGFTRSAISMYETGQRTPPPDKISALAKALGMPLEELTDSITTKAGRSLKAVAEEAYLRGEFDEAFRESRKFQRWARGTDDPIYMHDADALVSLITAHMASGEILDAELKDLPISSLDSMFHMARSAHPRQRYMMMMASTMLIRKIPEGTPDYWRAIRDRARLCLDMGYFSTAAHWYRTATCDEEQSFDRKLQAQIAAWQAEMYAGEYLHDDVVEQAKVHSVRSPLTWQLYWGLLLRRCWLARDWKALEEFHREAVGLYPTAWSVGYRIAFLGVEAILDWVTKHELATARRLKAILGNDRVNALAGLDVAESLWEDWLLVVRELDQPEGPLDWASYIMQLIAEGRDGRARWFIQRMPEPRNMPLGMALAIKRFSQHVSPWRDPLLGPDEPVEGVASLTIPNPVI